MASEPAAGPEAIVFRPSKKRKIYRRRASNASDDENAANPISPPPAQSLDELIASSAHAASEAESSLSVAEILRLRKQRKPKTGVEFKALGNLVRNDDGELVEKEGKGREEEVAGGGKRFAPQTGTVADVNKHMMAYIDSELAKRRTAEAPSGAQATMSNAFVREGAGLPEVKRADKEANRQPATIGKLMEIDLGDEVRSRNIEQTERARRRLEGEEIVDEEVVTKPVKVRLGPDGQPWRSKKKRRGSDDIKRDKLVEEILRENRLEIYDELPPEPEIKDDQAADDRIAEAFRKEFMDSQRERKKPASAPPPSRNPAKRKEEEELKGPKLGGSRSARAAMKEAMLKQSKK